MAKILGVLRETTLVLTTLVLNWKRLNFWQKGVIIIDNVLS